jgi:cytochrome P450
LRPFVQKYYGNVVRRYIRNEIEERFRDLKAERISSTPSCRAHSVISLALEASIAKDHQESTSETARLDDTTSSTIVFAFHLMSKHRKALAQLRDEHDSIFGKDISKAADLLKTQPSLLNQCRYTLAFIKETLRLYPPAANMRLGQRDIALPALNGQMLQTGGLNIILLHQIIHQNPRVWARTDEFLPERWLVEPGHDLYPPEGAFRPFDIGPRSCIGQTLTLNEIRIVLILAVRKFSIKPAYEEWDDIQTEREASWSKIASRLLGEKLNKVRGDRAYQTEKAGTHPSDGYPCIVSYTDQIDEGKNGLG